MPPPLPTLDDFRAIIDADGLTPDSVRDLNDLATKARAARPPLPFFFAKAVFGELSERWDDPQAIPSSEFNTAQQVLLPRLRIWMQSEPSFNDPAEMARVVEALVNCYPT
jgi:hypothetical protein